MLSHSSRGVKTGVGSSWSQHIHSHEANGSWVSARSLFTQYRILAREQHHPQWTGLPILISSKDISPQVWTYPVPDTEPRLNKYK